MNDPISEAELEFLVRKFDPAELFALEQARQHSVDLIQKWLVKYKFRNWKRTETRDEPVSDQYKEERARNIAELLGDPKEWNSHGRGIPLRTLSSDRVKLKVIDFGANVALTMLRLMEQYVSTTICLSTIVRKSGRRLQYTPSCAYLRQGVNMKRVTESDFVRQLSAAQSELERRGRRVAVSDRAAVGDDSGIKSDFDLPYSSMPKLSGKRWIKTKYTA